MKRQEENNQENNKDLLDELYDIDNLKNDLDEVLNLEGITVSESLIQATLQKVNKANEDNVIPYRQKVTGKKRGFPFRYGMIAACACILLIAGINLATNNSPLEMGNSKNNGKYQEETAGGSSTESKDMESNASTDMTEDSVSETDTEIMIPTFFDIAKEDGESYEIKMSDIEKIVVYDENDEVVQSEMDSSLIVSIYEAFSMIDTGYYEEVLNDEHKGQYEEKYAIIANEGVDWSELYLWITSTDQETYIVTKQLKTSDGETITYQITDVSADIIQKIIDIAP